MRVEVTREVDRREWDDELGAIDHATIFPTASLGEFNRAYYGFEGFYRRCSIWSRIETDASWPTLCDGIWSA